MPGATAIRRQAVAAPAAPSTGASQPSTARPTRPAAGPRRLQQRQAVGPRQRGAEHAGHPALDQVAGEPGELAGHGLEGGAFHLAQLDGEHLQQMAVGVHRGGAPAVGRAHEPARDVEPDGPLARPRAGRGVDRHHARGVEDAGGRARSGRAVPRAPAPGTPAASRADRAGAAIGSPAVMHAEPLPARCPPGAARSSAGDDRDAQHVERERLEQQRAARSSGGQWSVSAKVSPVMSTMRSARRGQRRTSATIEACRPTSAADGGRAARGPRPISSQQPRRPGARRRRSRPRSPCPRSARSSVRRSAGSSSTIRTRRFHDAAARRTGVK